MDKYKGKSKDTYIDTNKNNDGNIDENQKE